MGIGDGATPLPVAVVSGSAGAAAEAPGWLSFRVASGPVFDVA